MIQAVGGLVVVSGNGVYTVSSSFVATLVGTIGTSSGPVSMVDGASQLLIADGTKNVYVWSAALVFSVVILPFSVTTLFYQDGFFLANEAGTKQWAQSNLNDGSTWNALNFSSADAQPDPIVGGIDINREAWLLKANGVEVWYNAGSAGFAFARMAGVFMEQGCAAAFSIAKIPSGPIWLGSGERGAGIVWMANGYRPERLSTHSIETAIAGYSTIADAISFVYESAGHMFYVLTFPTGNATWVCDLTEPQHPWHQRAYFSGGLFSRHRSNSYAFAYGRQVFGDYVNGNLYAFNMNTYTDAGQPRKWLRSWRALPPNRTAEEPIRFDSLTIEGETGVSTPAGTNPQFMLRWADDGGHNFNAGGPIFASAGKTGETAIQVKYRRLGSTKINRGLDRVWELSATDPIKVALTGASMEIG